MTSPQVACGSIRKRHSAGCREARGFIRPWGCQKPWHRAAGPKGSRVKDAVNQNSRCNSLLAFCFKLQQIFTRSQPARGQLRRVPCPPCRNSSGHEGIRAAPDAGPAAWPPLSPFRLPPTSLPAPPGPDPGRALGEDGWRAVSHRSPSPTILFPAGCPFPLVKNTSQFHPVPSASSCHGAAVSERQELLPAPLLPQHKPPRRGQGLETGHGTP